MARILILIMLLLSSNAWAKDGFDSLISPGELASSHAKWEGITNCTKCHRLGGGLPDGNCLACHEKLAKQIKSNLGLHAKYTDPCVKCHGDHKGRAYKMISVEKDKFNHDRTDYPLKDSHSKVGCDKCHKKEGVYTGLSQKCNTCHDDKHKKQLSQDCENCHNFKKWKEIDKFKHSDSAYKLEGKHFEIKCEKCHAQGRFKPLEYKKCDDCHKDPHKRQFAGKTCESCHAVKGWKTTAFDHNSPDYKGYRLEGKHFEVKCEKCHVQGRFKPVDHKKCDDCHKDPHKRQFAGKTCESCHAVKGWKTTAFDHDSSEYKGYKLEGKHREVKCEKCHVQGRFKPVDHKKCDDCHKDPHKNQFAGKVCESCHVVKGWKTTAFDHSSPDYKGYKLEGKHIEVKCEKCHVQGKYKPLEYRKCDDCHKDPHKNQFAGKVCDSCHAVKGWKTTGFDHNSPSYNGYRLDGKHLKTPCEKCHADGKYKPIDTVCQNCHKKDDKHKGELGLVCKKCHTPMDWKKYELDHNLQTRFPLMGKHKDTDCSKCHKDKKYKTNQLKCLDCHKDPHKGSFKEECGSCHTQSDWQPRSFDHKKKTGFELQGLHNDAICANCHVSKTDYTKVSRLCSQCHLDPHLNQFGPVECGQCHAQTSWVPWRFDHSKTGFPLIGKHRLADCQDCHKNRLYRNTTGVCFNCHQGSFTAALNHVAKGFSIDCVTCHVTTFNAWDFKHPAINAGCATCHLNLRPASHVSNPTAYPTTCEACHTSTTSWSVHKHTSATTGCATCHLTYSTPARPADHTTNNWTVCENCHRYPSWTFVHQSVISGCSSCHLTYSNPPRPADHTTNNWTVCENCHKSTTAWLPVTHPSVTTGCATCHLTYSTPVRPADHTTNNWTVCENCHKSTTAWLPVTHPAVTSGCSSCHLTYSTPPRPADHTTNNWGTTCELCHKSTTAWLPVTHPTVTSGCSTCHLTYSTPVRPPDHTANNWTVCENCHKTTSTWTFTHPSVTSGCATCHLTYSVPAKPADHTTYGWTTCELCHKSTSTWTFTHPSTSFPLTHAGTSPGNCAACHPGGNYLIGGCIECHSSRGVTVHKTSSDAGCLSCHPTGQK